MMQVHACPCTINSYKPPSGVAIATTASYPTIFYIMIHVASIHFKYLPLTWKESYY